MPDPNDEQYISVVVAFIIAAFVAFMMWVILYGTTKNKGHPEGRPGTLRIYEIIALKRSHLKKVLYP